MWNALRFGAILVAAGALASTAAADGLPVLGVDVGSEGVATASGRARYVTLALGHDTIVARTAVAGGRVLGFRRLHGVFTVPAVAYDGSASGLSADGRRLVLIQPRVSFPRARTAFAVLDATRLRLRGVVTLRGDFSFDAISPDGGTMYLVHYVDPADATKYEVRAYDLRARKLLPLPIVDPHERDQMHGRPLTRATSADGRWAYTLYDGNGETPFVHALDTAGRTVAVVERNAAE